MSHLFSTVLNMSMTGSIVILLVMFARLILKRTPKIFSYALWSVVLFRLLCPVAFTAPVSALNALAPEVQEASELTSIVYYLPAELKKESNFTFVPAENQSGNQIEQPEPVSHTELDIMQVASYVWIAGTVVMLLYSVIQYIRLRLKLVGAMAYCGNVYCADYIDTPFVMGILSPKIYLPSDVPTKERKYIIAHERHHIRRFDHIIKLLAYFALCIHWFNPIVWAAFILAGKDMEMSCDEAVIRKLGSQIRADYSASLLRLSTHKKIIAGIPLAFGEGDTKGRVMNMAKWKKPKLWVSLICILLCTTILVACAVNPETAGSIGGMNTTIAAMQSALTVEKDALELCRTVLEEIQSSGAYKIETKQHNGAYALNETSIITVWGSGENRLHICLIPESGGSSTFGGLLVDGVRYECDSTQEWREITWWDWQDPWLTSFQWDESVIAYQDTMTDESGITVMLRIDQPFAVGKNEQPHYFVNFNFDADSTFRNVYVQANVFMNNAITKTESIVSLDPETVNAEIQKEYQRAIG